MSQTQEKTCLIIGLGNPGPKYLWTRHNVGFLMLDLLAHDEGLNLNLVWEHKSKFSASLAFSSLDGLSLIFLKPQTFMNLSGQSLVSVSSYFKVSLEQTVVIYDDLDCEFGQVKVRMKGSHGGHNGIRSVIEVSGRDQFPRIKVGIGRPRMPQMDVSSWVLSDFSKEELELLKCEIYPIVKTRLLELITSRMK